MKYSFFFLIACMFSFAPSIFASHYDITFPVVIDPIQNPYNQISQSGQTIFGNAWASIGNNSTMGNVVQYKTNGYPISSRISTINLDGGITFPMHSQYLCVSPKKDGKILWSTAYVYPSFWNEGRSRGLPFPRKQFNSGKIDGKDESFNIVNIHTLANSTTPVYFCGNNNQTIIDNLGIHPEDTLTYRIQYPVGTSIVAHSPSIISPYKNISIHSNYASGSISTWFLFMESNLDFCTYSNTCVTTSITAISLTEKKTDIISLRESYKKDNPEYWTDYFPIPADTATLDFVFGKK